MIKIVIINDNFIKTVKGKINIASQIVVMQ